MRVGVARTSRRLPPLARASCSRFGRPCPRERRAYTGATGTNFAMSQPPPTVSIIVPTRDRAGLLAETLASVRAQTFDAWEAIVVDDHSTDDTTRLVRDLG